jgi:tetratricopeptide (TPR) repeat protein
MANNRLEQLLAMMQKNPRDPFVLYGIAMEHKKAGDAPKAIEYFEKTLSVDPGYCYAYYQKGQVQESAGQSEEARQTYRAGIAAAQAKGDGHAAGEIAAALELLTE